MNRFTLVFTLLLSLGLIAGTTGAQDMMDDAVTFTVTVDNIATLGLYENAGVQPIPVDGDEAGPAVPGSGYEITFSAEEGQYLSFVTMLAQTNDLFFAPDATGIALYDMGAPISGDITDLIWLWDAGTEVNQPLGEGDQQAPRQAGPNTGDDENGVVALYDGIATADYISAEITANDDGTFTLSITNVSSDADVPSPITPVVWAVHSSRTDDMMMDDMMEDDMEESDDEMMDDDMMMDDMMAVHGVFFTEGEADYGYGLEAVAEDGNPAYLVATIAGGDFGTPITPVVYAVHDDMMDGGVFFTSGEADRGDGLENVAEDGDPANLVAYVTANYDSAGVAAIPSGAEEAGPALPGSGYSFEITASPGQALSFVTMFVQSNDLFYAPAESGIALFDENGHPIHGGVSGQIWLWDAGTEVNEEPGVGDNQAPRQAGPNTGDDEMGVVQLVDDGFTYPNATSIIRVTINPVDDMMMDG